MIGTHIAPKGGEAYVCYATLLSVTCDLPAKALVLNSMQFNGFYGCAHCLQQGEFSLAVTAIGKQS
jgi:hypothetical protein